MPRVFRDTGADPPAKLDSGSALLIIQVGDILTDAESRGQELITVKLGETVGDARTKARGRRAAAPGLALANCDDYAGQIQRLECQPAGLTGIDLPVYEAVNLYLTVVVNHLLKIGYDASRHFDSVADTESDA